VASTSISTSKKEASKGLTMGLRDLQCDPPNPEIVTKIPDGSSQLGKSIYGG